MFLKLNIKHKSPKAREPVRTDYTPRAPALPFDQVLCFAFSYSLLGYCLGGKHLATKFMFSLVLHLMSSDLPFRASVQENIYIFTVECIFTLFVHQVKFGLVKVVNLQHGKVVFNMM